MSMIGLREGFRRWFGCGGVPAALALLAVHGQAIRAVSADESSTQIGAQVGTHEPTQARKPSTQAAAERPGAARTKKKPGLEAATEPAPGTPEAIGDYSSGCVQGAAALPLDGTGYQVMHPSRNRHFGHPSLVSFLEGLGKSMAQAGELFLIGDLGQPRGGRAKGGHASHQSGLDVDIWFWHPKAAKERALTTAEREQLSARSVLDGKQGSIRKDWAKSVRAMLRFSADDPRVERMFVHPIIKRELCATEDPDPDERAWLRKVRPWYGHDDHVHVRLACPADSKDCVSQAPIPAGDGCEELDWWFDEKAQADREQARSRYRAKVVRSPELPERCLALLP